MIDLAPDIFRQRLVIEGIPLSVIDDGMVKDYLNKLSEKIGMKTLLPAVTHRSDTYGEAGWIHWESSGAHFYAWEQPRLFFSVDIYTCKSFDVNDAVKFTNEFFNPRQIEYKSF